MSPAIDSHPHRLRSSFALRTGLRFALVLLVVASHLSTGVAQRSSTVADEESENYYKKWLDQDVLYIISPEERDVFLKLTTPEEKDQFIEQFWKRRDPNPSTRENEFKTEHYRRIAYANEAFHSGQPGWQTDRGMIYIKHGPPDGIEKMPQGGFYSRKGREGGGWTSVYPFEVWFYRHLDGVGEGIEIEFVDASKTNEYKIALSPDEKDALIHVPNAGLTDAEAFGSETRSDRIRRKGLGSLDRTAFAQDRTFYQTSSRDMPFEKLRNLFRLERAPVIQFKDLEKVVDVKVSYNQLPFELRLDEFRISDQLALVPATVFVKNKDLTFEDLSGAVTRATVDIYGRVERPLGEVEFAFEDTIRLDVVKNELTGKLQEVSTYQKRLPLPPGRFKLSLVLRDHASGRMGTDDRLVVIPNRSDTDELFASSVILSRRVEEAGAGENFGAPFTLGKYKVRPVTSNVFTPADQFVQTYFEVYNLLVDESTQAPDFEIRISLLASERHSKELRTIFPYTPISNEFEYLAGRLLIYKTIPFQGLVPGNYTLKFLIEDHISEKKIENSVDFVIKAERRR